MIQKESLGLILATFYKSIIKSFLQYCKNLHYKMFLICNTILVDIKVWCFYAYDLFTAFHPYMHGYMYPVSSGLSKGLTKNLSPAYFLFTYKWPYPKIWKLLMLRKTFTWSIEKIEHEGLISVLPRFTITWRPPESTPLFLAHLQTYHSRWASLIMVL